MLFPHCLQLIFICICGRSKPLPYKVLCIFSNPQCGFVPHLFPFHYYFFPQICPCPTELFVYFFKISCVFLLKFSFAYYFNIFFLLLYSVNFTKIKFKKKKIQSLSTKIKVLFIFRTRLCRERACSFQIVCN